jgi:hypothetical protein
VEISTLDGEHSATHRVPAHAGVNRWFWDLRFPPSPAERAEFEERMAEFRAGGGGIPGGFGMRGPQGSVAEAGTYRVTLSVGGETVTGTVSVRNDPGIEGVLPSVR